MEGGGREKGIKISFQQKRNCGVGERNMGTLLLMRKSDWFDRGERKNFAAASSTAAATTFAATRSIAAATAFHHPDEGVILISGGGRKRQDDEMDYKLAFFFCLLLNKLVGTFLFFVLLLKSFSDLF